MVRADIGEDHFVSFGGKRILVKIKTLALTWEPGEASHSMPGARINPVISQAVPWTLENDRSEKEWREAPEPPSTCFRPRIHAETCTHNESTTS